MFTRRSLLLFVLALAGLASGAAGYTMLGVDSVWTASDTFAGIQMDATYTESPDNGLIDLDLDVGIDNGPANTEFLIVVKGKLLGSTTTDAFGNADWNIQRLGRAIGPDGRPIGKRINTGDPIRVGNRALRIDFRSTFQPVP